MMGVFTWPARSCLQISTPLMPGSRRSTSTRSGFIVMALSKPVLPSPAITARKPSCSSITAMVSRRFSSSSITKIVCILGLVEIVSLLPKLTCPRPRPGLKLKSFVQISENKRFDAYQKLAPAGPTARGSPRAFSLRNFEADDQADPGRPGAEFVPLAVLDRNAGRRQVTERNGGGRQHRHPHHAHEIQDRSA